jgi:hypothetical protein
MFAALDVTELAAATVTIIAALTAAWVTIHKELLIVKHLVNSQLDKVMEKLDIALSERDDARSERDVAREQRDNPDGI